MPGHSDKQKEIVTAGTAQSSHSRGQQQPMLARQHPGQGGHVHFNHSSSKNQRPKVGGSQGVLLPGHGRGPQYVQQIHRRPRLTGPPLPPVPSKEMGTNEADVDDGTSSMGVEELEAMLAEKKRKLEQMMARQSSTNSIDGSVDGSSVESGFVSLAGREEERRLGQDERQFGDRQKELTEQGGLYSNWGMVIGGGNPQVKRMKIDFENNVDKPIKVGGIQGILKSKDDDGGALNNNLDEKIVPNSDESDEIQDEGDSDDSISGNLCIADSEELAVLANLEKKFPGDQVPIPKTVDASNYVNHLRSPNPHELTLFNDDCQFSSEPESENEEEDSEGGGEN